MSLTWSAHISWLFRELPYSERVAAARHAGFRRIETAWPESVDTEALVRAVAEQEMAVVLVNCNAGDATGGERGFLNDPARREQAERDFLDAAELALRLGAPNLNVLVGRELPDVPRALQHRSVVSALRTFAPHAASRGLRILLEPVNAIENPGYLAPAPEDVVALIEECDSDVLGVLLDVYHVARAGADPVAAIERCAAHVGHVQISDCPGRGQPGSGALEVRSILEALQASGYAGSLGLEYEPAAGTAESLELLWREHYPVGLV